MKEELSAFIDGELQGEGLQAHLGRLRTDPGLRKAWDTYHLIGDALRGQISPEIATRVVARLREEPTVLAPRPEKRNSIGRLGWYAMSAAASVASGDHSGLYRAASGSRELPASSSALFS